MIFTSKPSVELDIMAIMKKLPHRYPFLLVDKVINITKDDHITAIKNVTINEPFFQGHFPAEPIMPGVLIIESMAQVSGILAFHSLFENAENPLCYFLSIENARFRVPVRPGDTLVIKSEIEHARGLICKFKCEASVDGKRVSEAVIRAKVEG